MSYTKGPWLIAVEDKRFVYAVGPKGTNLFWTRVDKAGPEKISDREAEANARLISKAPEMLELLKKCRESFMSFPRSLGYEITDVPAIDKLIAEIEGEQPTDLNMYDLEGRN